VSKNPSEVIAAIRLAIEDGTGVDHRGSYYDDPAMTLGAIEDILNDNPVEYKYRVVNKRQKYKTFSVDTLAEAEMMLDEPGDKLQRKPVGSRWEDI
jgi:hypothetical protein